MHSTGVHWPWRPSFLVLLSDTTRELNLFALCLGRGILFPVGPLPQGTPVFIRKQSTELVLHDVVAGESFKEGANFVGPKQQWGDEQKCLHWWHHPNINIHIYYLSNNNKNDRSDHTQPEAHCCSENKDSHKYSREPIKEDEGGKGGGKRKKGTQKWLALQCNGLHKSFHC